MSFLESVPVTAKDLLVVHEGLEAKISGKQDILSTAAGTLDATPQAGSARPLSSGAVHSNIATLTSQLSGKLSTSGGTLTGGIAISGFANGIACGGATPESGNVVTTGACNAAGGYNASNGGLHVANDITTTGGAVVTNTLKANSGTTVSIHTGQTLNASTLSASTVNATTVNPTSIANCSFFNGQGITQGGGILLRNERVFNPNRVNNAVVTRVNTISDTDTGGVEGGPRSMYDINMRTKRRNVNYELTEVKFKIECGHAGDNNGRRDHMIFRGTSHSNSTYRLSDDRCKFDEIPLVNALDTIKKIKVLQYQKYNGPIRADLQRPLDEGNGELEIGVIAQDIEQIPELAHLVQTIPTFDDEVIAKKEVDYEQLFTVALQAIQELEARVEALEKVS